MDRRQSAELKDAAAAGRPTRERAVTEPEHPKASGDHRYVLDVLQRVLFQFMLSHVLIYDERMDSEVLLVSSWGPFPLLAAHVTRMKVVKDLLDVSLHTQTQ